MRAMIEDLNDVSTAAEIGDVFGAAMVDYPVMLRAYAHAKPSRQPLISRMIGRLVYERVSTGRPVLAARVDNKIVGGALCQHSDFVRRDWSDGWWEGFLAETGPELDEFFKGFVAAVEAIKVPEPNMFLSIIAVHPEYQGRGIGRQLIERVVEIGKQSPGCLGVSLDTETAHNVQLYGSCGFEVVGETAYGDLPIWVMFRAF